MHNKRNWSITCCWGSMQRGKQLLWVVRIPFCTDSSSGGRPWDVHLKKYSKNIIHHKSKTDCKFFVENAHTHLLILTSEVRCSWTLHGWVRGIPLSNRLCSQSSWNMVCLYSKLNGPAYDRNAADKMQFPSSCFLSSWSFARSRVHLQPNKR